MKKKIFLVASLSFLALAACSSNKEDNETLRFDVLDDAHLAMYNLTGVKDNTSIYELGEDAKVAEDATYDKKERSGSYYDIYLASNVESSLFTYRIDFGQIFDDNKDYYKDNKFKNAKVKTIQFSDSIRSSERSGIMSELYNKNYGVKTILDEDIINIGNAWSDEVDAD